MDSFELNKILGAILGTLLFVMGIGFLAEAIYEPGHSGPSYDLPTPPPADGSTTTAPAPVVDIGTLLAKADPKAGAESARVCQACHDFTEGGPNKIGPNLYDVVERPIASHPGFAYSDDLSKLKDQTWTYQLLNKWLTSPKSVAPGTKMTFAGISDDGDRANVIAYLSTLSHSPKPFPAPAAASSSAAPAGSSSASEAPPSSSLSPNSPSNAVETPSASVEGPTVAASSAAPAPSSAASSSADAASASAAASSSAAQ
ncbi:MAG TPA: cytochrome c family protein [Devosia sp.]|nr:cytochrome c family protein [Devosia sp.]